MKYVIIVMNISIGLTQCGLIWGLRRDDFIMKLINVLINFWVLRHAEIWQFDRFLQELISKEHVIVIMEVPDWVQVKKTIL